VTERDNRRDGGNVVDLKAYAAARNERSKTCGSYSILFGLVSDDPLYAAGFEAGQQWEVMKNFKKSNIAEYIVIVRETNEPQIRNMAESISLTIAESKPTGEGWQAMRITK
jgi:hypothetical protein